MLDHLTDPHNVGAIVRTAEAAGARRRLILPARRSAGINATVRKAAAGAAAHLPIARVANIAEAIRVMKKGGHLGCRRRFASPGGRFRRGRPQPRPRPGDRRRGRRPFQFSQARVRLFGPAADARAGSLAQRLGRRRYSHLRGLKTARVLASSLTGEGEPPIYLATTCRARRAAACACGSSYHEANRNIMAMTVAGRS